MLLPVASVLHHSSFNLITLRYENINHDSFHYLFFFLRKSPHYNLCHPITYFMIRVPARPQISARKAPAKDIMVTDSVMPAHPKQHSCCISLMAEPNTAVIQLKPFEESQCPTTSPETSTMTIKGYYRHFSISHAPSRRLTTAIHFYTLLCYYILSIPTPSIRYSFLSTPPSLSMLHH